MTETEVRARIIAWIDGRELQECATELGVTKSWLCQMRSGYRRPCGRILDHLGIQRQPRQRPFKDKPLRPFKAAC